MLLRVFCIIAVIASLCAPAEAQGMWVKGNLHCHTTNSSDADSSPSVVANWYRDNGYQFIAFSDHNYYTAPITMPSDFIILKGQEISSWTPHSDHVGAYGAATTIWGASGSSDPSVFQSNINNCNSAGGFAVVNHPNYQYPLSAADMMKLTGCNLFEVWNASTGCNNPGDATHPSTDKNWDTVLSAGYTWYGVASDDAHNFAPGHWGGSSYYNPGCGWIVAYVKSFTESDIMAAIKKGDFYSSTGPRLSSAFFDGTRYHITVEPKTGVTYLIRFSGLNGVILKTVTGTDATYTLTGSPNEAYVRARVFGVQDSTQAWTQPVKAGGFWP